MMKTVIIECSHCGNSITKQKKEYDRRVRSGATRFFCNRTCTGLGVAGNLPSEYCRSQENRDHLAKICMSGAKFHGDDRAFQEHFRRCRQRKKKECTITLDDLRALWDDQAGICALSGIKLDLWSKDKNVAASVDRRDSSVGYVPGNIQWVSCAINWAKGNRPDSDLRALLKLIRE